MNPRRLYGPSVLGAMATGGLAFLAATRTWASATVTATGVPTDQVEVTGSDAVPLASAFALVIVAAALAVLAASVRVRRLVGLFIIGVALAGLVVVMTAGNDVDEAVTRAIRESPAFIGTNVPDLIENGPWRFVAAAAFLLAILIGAVITRFAGEWLTMGRKYDAPKAHAATEEISTEADIWKALDDGRDPTQ